MFLDAGNRKENLKPGSPNEPAVYRGPLNGSLAVGGLSSPAVQELMGREEHFMRWVEHPASSILHHDDDCCEEGRLWFLAYARSMEIGSLSQFKLKAPTWLSQL